MSGETSPGPPPGYEIDPTAYGVREVEGLSILNDGQSRTVTREGVQVHFHDLRAQRLNSQFAQAIEHAKVKACGAEPQTVGFMEEAVCHASDVYCELSQLRVGDKFLYVTGKSRHLEKLFHPDAKGYDFKMDVLRNPEQVPGRSVVFTGVGQSSNFYHWVGEQMPKLATLSRYVDLAEVDNICVFVKQEVGFVEESIRTLFPTFQGTVRQIRGWSMYTDEAYFFVLQTVPGVSQAPPRGKGVRASIGSLFDLIEHVEAQADRLFEAPPGGPEIAVISREKAPMRRWLNEDALLAALGDRAQSVLAEDLSFRDQMNLFRHAKVIVATHGAGLANTLFCQPGARVIEVTSRNHVRRTWDFAKLAVARGVDYHVAVVDAVDDSYWQEIAEPAETVPFQMGSDLTASDEAIAALAQLCG